MTDFEVDKLIKKVSPTNTKSKNSISLDKNNSLIDIILDNYWNALWSALHDYQSSGDVTEYDLRMFGSYSDEIRRADTICKENFKTGDILIYKNTNDVLYSYRNNSFKKRVVTAENGEYAYIFIEGYGFVGINYGEDGIANSEDDRNAFTESYYSNNNKLLVADSSEHNYYVDDDLAEYANYQTLFGKDYFVILRPSLRYQCLAGDIDGDKSITIMDVRLLLQEYINANSLTEFDANDLAIMDLDSNRTIDLVDVRLLLQMYTNQ